MPIEFQGVKISWLGHDAFRVTDDRKVIYIDPYRIKGGIPADVVLITHDHFDHFSPPDISKVSTDKTSIVAPYTCEKQVKGLRAKEVKFVKPWDELVLEGIEIKAVPAYNTTKFREPGIPFHPKEYGGVGYIFTIGGVKVYHTGDTDYIPEMKNLSFDVILVPVSGTYVMTAEEAAMLVNDLKPKLAIPMHFGAIVGSQKDAETFKKLAKCEVAIPKKED